MAAVSESRKAWNASALALVEVTRSGRDRMTRLINKAVVTGGSSGVGLAAPQEFMKSLINILIRSGILTEDLDYHLIRASMVIIFLFFGYQKWFQYEADVLIPYISNGPLIFWLYPVFGVRGATWFLGASEWSFGALLFLGAIVLRKYGPINPIAPNVSFLPRAICGSETGKRRKMAVCKVSQTPQER